MSLCFILIIGLVLISIVAVFWSLIVLDLENQRNQQIFTPSPLDDIEYKN